jgi:hypothetical protein
MRLVAVRPDSPPTRHLTKLIIHVARHPTKPSVAAPHHHWIRKAIDKRCVEPHPKPPRRTMQVELGAVALGDAAPARKPHSTSVQVAAIVCVPRSAPIGRRTTVIRGAIRTVRVDQAGCAKAPESGG